MPVGSNAVIKIPIQAELQNSQSIVKELRDVLSKIKPDTRGFGEVNTLLDQAQKKLESVYERSSHGIVDKKGLSQIESEFESALTTIERAARKIQNFKFDNLILTPEQISQFTEISTKINEAKDAYSKLEKVKLTGLIKNSKEFSDNLNKTGINLDADGIDSSLKKVDAAIKKTSKSLDDLATKRRAAAINSSVRGEEIEQLEQLKKAFSGDSKTRATLSEYFSASGNFKAGGNAKLVQQLQSMLGLDDVTADKIKKLSASKLQEIYGEIEKKITELQDKKTRERQQSDTDAKSYAEQIVAGQADLGSLQSLRQGIAGLKVDPEIKNALGQLTERLIYLEQENERLKQSMLGSSGASDAARDAFQKAGGAAEKARKKFEITADELDALAQSQRNMESIKYAISNFLGFNQVLNAVRNGIRNAINHIKELDTTMNGIAIVTNMATADLWKQVDAYSSMAQKFGVTIQGAYEVSKIYYQAGYETNEVLTLTNETLKLSKISGLDYATTTDYMMTAMRGFKLEMEEASKVVDVYSNLAANTAVSQQELAEAMTRTASSMESVGATFEETSAMIATMVAVTRESANNIGSAMKSIASRYGELTKDPGKLFDAEGEAMSFNKVDTALKSVGITLQTTEHQFRDFTDVIIELAEKWDTLDSAQQRYIATQFAGNRQQSRFLALVSNVDLLKENISNAENSEDVGTLQYLKSLDSLESKINQVQVAYQQFYTTIGLEDVWKNLLDGTKNVINTLNNLPKLFGKIPVLAIGMIANIISVIRSLLRGGFRMIVSDWNTVMKQTKGSTENSGTEIGKGLITRILEAIRARKQEVVDEFADMSNKAKNAALTGNASGTEETVPKVDGNKSATDVVSNTSKLGNVLNKVKGAWSQVFNRVPNGLVKGASAAGDILSTIGLIIPMSKQASGALMGIGGVLKVLGAAASAHPVLAVLSGVMMAVSGIATMIEKPAERLERLTQEAEELNNKAKEVKSNYNILQRSIDKVEELRDKRYESAEAAEEYQAAVDELAEAFPEMISGFDEAGNVIVDITDKENILAEARKKSAEATYAAAKADLKVAQDKQKTQAQTAQEELKSINDDASGKGLLNYDIISEIYGDYQRNLNNDFQNYATEYINNDKNIAHSEQSFYQELLTTWGKNIFQINDNNRLSGIRNKYLESKNVKLLTKDKFEENLKGLVEELQRLTDLSFDELLSNENIKSLNKLKNELIAYQDNEAAKEYVEKINNLISSLKEYKVLEQSSANNIKLLVSSWQSLIGEEKELHYITDNSGLSQILTSHIVNDLDTKGITSADDIDAALNSGEYDKLQQALEEYWTELAINKDAAEQLTKMLTNTERYTSEDIFNQFSDMDPIIKDLIKEAYQEREGKVKDNLKKSIGGMMGSLDSDAQNVLQGFVNVIDETAGIISYEEAQVFNATAKKYVDLVKNGLGDQGAQLLIGVENLLYAVKDNPLEEAYLFSLINSNSLFTKEGVQNIIDEVNKNEELDPNIKENLIKSLYQVKNNLVDNLALSVQQAITDLEEGWEDTSKEMAKLRSGATLKEVNTALERAKSLGVEISRSDFTGPANKLVLSEGKFYEYFYASQKEMQKQANYMEEQTKKAEDIINNNDLTFEIFTKKGENGKDGNNKLFSDILGEAYYGSITAENFNAEEIKTKINEYYQNVEDFQLMLKQTQDQMLREINWAIGNYSDIYKTGFTEGDLRAAAAQGGRNLGRTQTVERSAVKKINDAYNKLISDTLSKGFSNIDISSYEGLFDLGNGIELRGSYADFVRKYASLAGKTAEEFNSLMVQAIEKDQKTVTTMASTVKNMSSLSVSQIGSIATLLSEQLGQVVDPSAIINSIQQNADGSYNGSEYIVSYLIPKLFGTDVPEAVQEALNTTLTSAVESAVKGLEDVGNNLTKGFGSIADVEKFEEGLKNVDFNSEEGKDYKYEENQYILTYSGLRKAIKNYQIELVKNLKLQGKTQEEITEIVTRETKELLISLAGQIDIQKYLSSERTDTDRNTLKRAYKNWQNAMAVARRFISLSFEEFKGAIEAGGESAVQIAETIARESNVTLSAKDIESLYRAKAVKLDDAIQQLTYGIGSIVDETTAKIIGLKHTDQIAGTSQYVITSTYNLADAYHNLYEQMKATNVATIGDLNKIKAAELEARSDKNVIEALGDAQGMTYTRLGEILEKQGIKLTDTLINRLTGGFNAIIEDIGNGQIRILDFERFANLIGLSDTDSEAYLSAFKTYNDSIVELNNKTERNIMEEVQKIAAGSVGDTINLTYLSDAFKGSLEEFANKYGAEFSKGILTITSNTNITGLISAIMQQAKQDGILLKDQLAELADTLSQTLDSYIELFRKGISGTLGYKESVQLADYAKSLDINLDFSKTAEGLKISADSATQLYSKIKEIDSLKASLVFDDLAESLKKSEDGLSNITETLTTISKMEKELSNSPQNDAVRERLNLYKEIAVQQMNDPSQYSFMDRALPSGMQGVQNYWNSVGTAFKAMNEAGQTGYIGIQDFYNIANEMQNLAVMSGKDLMFMGHTIYADGTGAAELIEQSMSALTNVDGEGLKYDLTKLGQNMTAGAEGMQSGFDDGIRAMAEANIAMLDAAIQMLEGIVALQELGNIDDNGDGIFTESDMFNEFGEYTEAYQDARQKFIDFAEKNPNSDLAKALDTVKIGNVTLRDFLTKSAKELSDLGISIEQQFAIISQLKDIDFENADLQEIQSKIQEFIASIFNFDFDPNDRKGLGKVAEYLKNTKQKVDNVYDEMTRIAMTSKEHRSIQDNIKLKIFSGKIEFDTEKQKYIVNNKEYTDPADALAANILDNINVGSAESKVTTTINEGIGHKTFKFDGGEVNIDVDPEGHVYYRINGVSGKTLDEAIKTWLIKQNAMNEISKEITSADILAFKYNQRIEINPIVELKEKDFLKENKAKIDAAKDAIEGYFAGIYDNKYVQDTVGKVITGNIQVTADGALSTPQLENVIAKLEQFEDDQNSKDTLDVIKNTSTEITNAVETASKEITTAINNLNNIPDGKIPPNTPTDDNPPPTPPDDNPPPVATPEAQENAAVNEKIIQEWAETANLVPKELKKTLEESKIRIEGADGNGVITATVELPEGKELQVSIDPKNNKFQVNTAQIEDLLQQGVSPQSIIDLLGDLGSSLGLQPQVVTKLDEGMTLSSDGTLQALQKAGFAITITGFPEGQSLTVNPDESGKTQATIDLEQLQTILNNGVNVDNIKAILEQGLGLRPSDVTLINQGIGVNVSPTAMNLLKQGFNVAFKAASGAKFTVSLDKDTVKLDASELTKDPLGSKQLLESLKGALGLNQDAKITIANGISLVADSSLLEDLAKLGFTVKVDDVPPKTQEAVNTVAEATEQAEKDQEDYPNLEFPPDYVAQQSYLAAQQAAVGTGLTAEQLQNAAKTQQVIADTQQATTKTEQETADTQQATAQAQQETTSAQQAAAQAQQETASAQQATAQAEQEVANAQQAVTETQQEVASAQQATAQAQQEAADQLGQAAQAISNQAQETTGKEDSAGQNTTGSENDNFIDISKFFKNIGDAVKIYASAKGGYQLFKKYYNHKDDDDDNNKKQDPPSGGGDNVTDLDREREKRKPYVPPVPVPDTPGDVVPFPGNQGEVAEPVAKMGLLEWLFSKLTQNFSQSPQWAQDAARTVGKVNQPFTQSLLAWVQKNEKLLTTLGVLGSGVLDAAILGIPVSKLISAYGGVAGSGGVAAVAMAEDSHSDKDVDATTTVNTPVKDITEYNLVQLLKDKGITLSDQQQLINLDNVLQAVYKFQKENYEMTGVNFSDDFLREQIGMSLAASGLGELIPADMRLGIFRAYEEFKNNKEAASNLDETANAPVNNAESTDNLTEAITANTQAIEEATNTQEENTKNINENNEDKQSAAKFFAENNIDEIIKNGVSSYQTKTIINRQGGEQSIADTEKLAEANAQLDECNSKLAEAQRLIEELSGTPLDINLSELVEKIATTKLAIQQIEDIGEENYSISDTQELLKLKQELDNYTKKLEEVQKQAEELSKTTIDVKTDQSNKNLDSTTNAANTAKEAITGASGLRVTTDATQSITAANNVTTAWNNAGVAIKNTSKIAAEAATTQSIVAKLVLNKAQNTMGAAKGNVALAKGRNTLMGELGPELYVSGGHYYVAGQNGAEFVNLPDDAIVFNHLQTERLLKNGSAGRGKAVTNDRKATSFATGNVSGPAMASAQAVLAQLKQLRAMWDAILNASLSDFGSKAGMGKKGGGGGSKNNNNNTVSLDSGYIKDLERWYNLLRKIEKLEQDISYEEKLRAKHQADTVGHGKEIYESQRRSYEALQKEVDSRKELAELKKGYYEQQMEELKNSKWSDFFYFDEEGTIQRKTSGSQFLANLYATNAEGGAVHSAREQYQMLMAAGYGSLMEYKEDGSKIKKTDSSGKPREEFYAESVKAFSAKIDSQTEAYESLREDYMKEMEAILETQTKQNEILNAIRDNTIAVEQEVLKALEDSRQREIDELEKQKDAISESTDKFINGLTDQLNKERQMYTDQENQKELTQLQRQLGILQRSGAPESQIRDTREKVNQMQQDAYFTEQQNQINAIKEASDLQIQRLDAQISLMTETLEYQKAHGLLWAEVREIMGGTEQEIAQFITGNNAEWWAKSNEQSAKDLAALNTQIGEWVAHREDITNTGNSIKTALQTGLAAITEVTARRETASYYNVSGDGGYIPSTDTGSTNAGGTTDSNSKKTSAKKSTTTSVPKQQEHKYVVSYIPLGSNSTVTVNYSSLATAQAAVQRFKKLGFKRVTMAQQYKEGGLIDYTGPAWVDGTKKKPEGILNAEQLDMLRNSVLTRKNPVAALLADYSDTVSNTANSSTYSTIDRGVNIENLEFNMNVAKMANDYDARQAARSVADEIIRISRKSSTTSVSRR